MSYRNTLINTWKSAAYYQLFVVVIVLLVLWKLGWQSAIAGFVTAEILHLMWWIDLK
ncbi:hypothetical protein [Tumidithrix elongata]|uniref:hypothetical protein n=1 Tax=Tumidithrix elongata TaxID=3088357 RepID=UPI002ED30CDB